MSQSLCKSCQYLLNYVPEVVRWGCAGFADFCIISCAP